MRYKGKCPYTPGICACDVFDCPDNHLGDCFGGIIRNNKKPKQKTNFEMLKAKNIDEMLDVLTNMADANCICCVYNNDIENCLNSGANCREGIKQWLESEVEE